MVRPKEISTPRSTVTAQTCELSSWARRGSNQRAEADADQGLAPTIRSHKVVVDVERNHCEISDFTVDDQNFEQQLKNRDAIRFLTVRYAHDVLGKILDESYDWASDNIDEPIARGGRDTMMKSYQKIRSQVGEIDRIRPRPRIRSRRGSKK
jgi:hypothetical protein